MLKRKDVNMLRFSTYMGYDITIDDNNGNGVIGKAEHPQKDILIKTRYFDHTKRYIMDDIKDQIRYMERIKD